MISFFTLVLPLAHEPSKWWTVWEFSERLIFFVSQSLGQK